MYAVLRDIQQVLREQFRKSLTVFEYFAIGKPSLFFMFRAQMAQIMQQQAALLHQLSRNLDAKVLISSLSYSLRCVHLVHPQ